MSGTPIPAGQDETRPVLKLAGDPGTPGSIRPDPPSPEHRPGSVQQADLATSRWLTLFLKTLRWNCREASGIRDELESHLQERTRDLMLSGLSEDRAVDQALRELGDAAGLARRFRLIRTLPFRRFMMNATILVGTGAALALSILAVSSKPAGGPQDQPATPSSTAGASAPIRRNLPETLVEAQVTRSTQASAPSAQPEDAAGTRSVISFPLRHVDASLLASRLMTRLRSAPPLLADGAPRRPDGPLETSVSVDQRTNSLIIAGPAGELRAAELWLAQNDAAAAVPTPPLATDRHDATDRVIRSVYTPEPRIPGELGSRTITASLQSVPLADAFAFIGAALDRQIVVHWAGLEPMGVPRDTPVTVGAKNASLVSVLEALESQLKSDNGSPRLAVRTDGQTIEFGTEHFFDIREITLVSYDLSLLDDGVSDESIISIIQSFVCRPEDWKQNGGVLAELKLCGRKMFVQAPLRFHRQIEWVLKELRATEAPGGK